MSKLFTVNLTDLVKGAILTALAGVLGTLSTLLQDGHFPTGDDWKSIGAAALTALAAYITKNMFTNSGGEFMKAENPVQELNS
jgi:hypothetical protein